MGQDCSRRGSLLDQSLHKIDIAPLLLLAVLLYRSQLMPEQDMVRAISPQLRSKILHECLVDPLSQSCRENNLSQVEIPNDIAVGFLDAALKLFSMSVASDHSINFSQPRSMLA